jgi:hypothetical protein
MMNTYFLEEPGLLSQYSEVEDRGSIPGRDRDISSSPPHPNQLWDPSSLLSSGYEELLTHSQGMKLTTQPASSAEVNVWSYTSTPPICLHGMVLS